MANLTTANVQLASGTGNLQGDERWLSKKGLFFRRLEIIGGTAGGQTNLITAAALGFNRIIGCSDLWDSAGVRVIRATVDPVNNIILLALGGTDTPADVTHTASYITVWGV